MRVTASLQPSKKDGKYYVHLNWTQGGKRFQKCVSTKLTVKGNNKRKAVTMMLDLQREWEAKLGEKHEDALFSGYMQEWLESEKHSIQETTFANYKIVVHNVICPYFEERRIKLSDLTSSDIRDFYKYKIEHDGITNNTIRHYHAYINKALKAALRGERIKRNPAEAVKVPTRQRHTVRFLTAEETKRLLEKAKGTKLETVVQLAVRFGLRRGEIIGLKWESIDFENHTLSILGTIAKADKLVYKRPKTTASLRSFPMLPDFEQYLLSVKEQQRANMKRVGAHYNHKWDEFVCVDYMGDLLKLDYVSRNLPKLCESAGIKSVGLHELRHTNISLLLEQGESMKALQEWAGHSSYTTTANIYAHLQADSKKKLAHSLQIALQ